MKALVEKSLLHETVATVSEQLLLAAYEEQVKLQRENAEHCEQLHAVQEEQVRLRRENAECIEGLQREVHIKEEEVRSIIRSCAASSPGQRGGDAENARGDRNGARICHAGAGREGPGH